MNVISYYGPNAKTVHYTQCDLNLLPDNLSVSYSNDDHRDYVLTDESEQSDRSESKSRVYCCGNCIGKLH